MIYIEASTDINSEELSKVPENSVFRQVSDKRLNRGDTFAAVFQYNGSKMDFVLIIPNDKIGISEPEEIVAAFMDESYDVHVGEVYWREIGHALLMECLYEAAEGKWFSDVNAVCDKYNIPYEFTDDRCSEFMMDDASGDVDTQCSFISDDMELIPLQKEIRRIYMKRNESKVRYNPVHYLIAAKSPDTRGRALRTLGSSLLYEGRIFANRTGVFKLQSFSNRCNDMEIGLDQFYFEYEGGIVVLDACDIEAKEYVEEHAPEIAGVIRKNKDRVLTVLLLGTGSESDYIKRRLATEMYGILMIDVTQNKISGGDLKRFIKAHYSNLGIRCNLEMVADISNRKQYPIPYAENLLDSVS